VFQSDSATQPSRQASVLKIPLVMADRTWELAVYPTAAYRSAHRPWIAWATAIVGLLLAVLLQVLLLVTSGHAAAIEDKVKSQGAELKDRATLINTLFEISPDGFVVVGSDHTIRLTNLAFHTMTGIAADEVIGRSIGHLDSCLKERTERPERFKSLETLFAASGTETIQQTLELARPREVVLQIVGVRSDASSIDRFICFRDVTRETEVDRMKSEFLSHAAHELRTPMASIYGFTELLMTQDFDEAERREFLDTIYRQSELMISIINELLDLVRIERGKDFTIERVDVGELLRDVVGGFKTPDDRPSPTEPSSDGPLRVSADRQKLIQAISNVISNAYKYSPDGGAIDIELVPPVSDHALLGIRITDQGIGMTPEQLAHVCERFYRADTSGKIPGTGLGMSIVKEIVELHGGRLELASKVGAGTTVTLWLPAADMQTNRGQPCSPRPAAAHQESPS
jgi:PAS domain S-box-containing protein